MSFAYPWLLVALVALPVAFAAWVRGARRGTTLSRLVSRETPARPRYGAALLLTLGAACAVVAAAQPRWGEREAFIPRNGAQLVVVLDVSRSMAVTDTPPTRIEAAKAALLATLSRLGGDRVGLVVFAGDARLRFPLTTDFSAAGQVIREIETGQVLVSAGTSASAGIDVAVTAFDKESDSGKLLVLITDGDDLGVDPAAAAQRVRDSGIDLIVAGAGTPAGGVVRVVDQRTKQLVDKLDAEGKPIVSKLNEPFLRALAAAAGGRYIGADPRLLAGAIEGRLAVLKRTRIERESATLPVERYPWFAGAALALFGLASLAERMPRVSRRTAALGAGAMLIPLLAACATEAHDLNQRGVEAFKAGDYAAASEFFLEAQAAKPNDPSVSLNLAAALHADGKFEEANQAARRAIAARDSTTRARGFASIGHHRFAESDLAAALAAFKQALFENPSDEASRHDYEVVLRLLQPEPPPETDPSRQPGETPTPGGATPSPGAGSTTTSPSAPASGTPDGTGGSATGSPSAAPGSATPPPEPNQRPGEGPSQPGAQPGQPPNQVSPGEAGRLIEQLDDQIARLLKDAGEQPTAAQAVAILNLLAERARLTNIRDSSGGRGDPKDY